MNQKISPKTSIKTRKSARKQALFLFGGGEGSRTHHQLPKYLCFLSIMGNFVGNKTGLLERYISALNVLKTAHIGLPRSAA